MYVASAVCRYGNSSKEDLEKSITVEGIGECFPERFSNIIPLISCVG